MSSRSSPAQPAPHSWDLGRWPPHVYPGTERRGRYVLRVHRQELLAAGALVRVGRELVVIGARYQRWLEKHAALVPDFECPANRPQRRRLRTQHKASA
jgi:hypothetical protein